MSDQKLPQMAVVDLNDKTLSFDGVKFPYYISEDGIDVSGLGDPNSLPLLSFGVFAKTIQVIPKDGGEPA